MTGDAAPVEDRAPAPTFGDPCARVGEGVHKASGARLVEVAYGAVNRAGEPVAPAPGDGHGHLIAIELDGALETLVMREPLGRGDGTGAATSADADQRDWDRAYRSTTVRDLERDLIYRRRLCSRIEGLARGGISTLRQVLDDIHREWDELRSWGVPVEGELVARFDAADARCLELLAEQQANMVTKEALVKEAQTLQDSRDWPAADARMRELFDRWRAVGSAGRDHDQALWERFNEARHAFFGRRDEHFRELRERRARSREEKERLLEEARESFREVDDWRAAGERMDDLMARWKAAGGAGREQEERLWAELREIRSDFSARRRAHYSELRRRRHEVADVKRGLVAEAAEIAALEDRSREQVERMKQLGVRWKEAGSAGHEADRALWAEFRAAQDGFWEARRLETSQMRAERSGRLQSAIDRRQDQIDKLYGQIDSLRDRLLTTRSPEKQEEINGWISEKGEIIARIEAEIEEIRRKL